MLWVGSYGQQILCYRWKKLKNSEVLNVIKQFYSHLITRFNDFDTLKIIIFSLIDYIGYDVLKIKKKT